MPQVLALVIAGAGLYAGYKWVRSVMARGEGKAAATPKDLGALDYDAKNGVYRPRKKA